MIPAQVSVTNNGNMNNYKDNDKRVDDAKEEYRRNWSNDIANNISSDKGKEKFLDKTNHNIKDGDCSKKRQR